MKYLSLFLALVLPAHAYTYAGTDGQNISGHEDTFMSALGGTAAGKALFLAADAAAQRAAIGSPATGDIPTWDTLTGKPSTFAPSTHTHAASDITSGVLGVSYGGTGNTSGSAATLTTGRTIGMTGDITWSSGSFNGSSNVTAAGTLATVNSNVGSFGSATQSLSATVNGKGLVTAMSAQTVTPAVGSITGLGTGVQTALAVNTGSAGSHVIYGGALGTPSSGTISGSFVTGGTFGAVNGSALTALNASSFTSGTVPAAQTSALTGDITKSAGSNATTLANIPAISGANLTGTAASLTAGLVTSIGNLTGDVTSSNRATTLASTISGAHTFSGQTELTGQTASTASSAMTRSLQPTETLWNLLACHEYPVNTYASMGVGSQGAVGTNGCRIVSGITAASYGVGYHSGFLTGGTSFNSGYPISFSHAGCFYIFDTSTTQLQAIRFVVGGPATPTFADQAPLTTKGFGWEIYYDTTATSHKIRAFAHNGTAITYGTAVSITTASNSLFQVIIQSTGAGTINLYTATCNNDGTGPARPSATPTATCTGAPTSGNLSNINFYLAAVGHSTLTATGAGAQITLTASRVKIN